MKAEAQGARKFRDNRDTTETRAKISGLSRPFRDGWQLRKCVMAWWFQSAGNLVAEAGETRVRRSYPLNSRRLTARVVNRIACSLVLPKSSLVDAQQMIEGQLAETRELQNVQVDIDAGRPEETAVIRLRYEDGVFLDIDTPDERELST